MCNRSLLPALLTIPFLSPAAYAQGWEGGMVGATAVFEDVQDQTSTISILALPIGPVPTGKYNKTAVALGLLAGYRVETGPVVLGAEVDADWSSATLTEADGFLTNKVKPRWRASLRAVAGIPAGKALVFGTAGWGLNATRHTYTFTMGDPIAPERASRTAGGLVAGGGVELALGRVHPRIEFRHARYKKLVNGENAHIFRHRLSSNSLRASIVLPL